MKQWKSIKDIDEVINKHFPEYINSPHFNFGFAVEANIDHVTNRLVVKGLVENLQVTCVYLLSVADHQSPYWCRHSHTVNIVGDQTYGFDYYANSVAKSTMNYLEGIKEKMFDQVASPYSHALKNFGTRLATGLIQLVQNGEFEKAARIVGEFKNLVEKNFPAETK